MATLQKSYCHNYFESVVGVIEMYDPDLISDLIKSIRIQPCCYILIVLIHVRMQNRM